MCVYAFNIVLFMCSSLTNDESAQSFEFCKRHRFHKKKEGSSKILIVTETR